MNKLNRTAYQQRLRYFLDDALLLNIPKNGIGFSVDAFKSIVVSIK